MVNVLSKKLKKRIPDLQRFVKPLRLHTQLGDRAYCGTDAVHPSPVRFLPPSPIIASVARSTAKIIVPII